MMSISNCYYLEFSTIDLIFIVKLTTFRPICPSAFLRCFMLNYRAHRESWTKPFIWTTGVDCSNSVNHDQVQVFSYSKYSLYSYLLLGLNLQFPDNFTQKRLPTQRLIHCAMYPYRFLVCPRALSTDLLVFFLIPVCLHGLILRWYLLSFPSFTNIFWFISSGCIIKLLFCFGLFIPMCPCVVFLP